LEWQAPSGGTPAFVGCSLTKSSSQSISNATPTAITFDGENFDTDAFHDNSTNNSRITIPSGKGGKYLITGVTSFAANATGVRVTKIYKNGIDSVYLAHAIAAAPATDFTNAVYSLILSLDAADYIQIYAEQSSSGSLNLNTSGAVGCFVQVQYLGA
jgi:hypothetical protein